MKKTVYTFLAALTIMGITASTALAHDANIITISRIVMHLKHYPSDSEKQTLAQITRDSHASAGEIALAGALMRMQHSVQGDDAATLHTVASNKQSSHDEQALATILLGIKHHPSAADQKQLQPLTQQ